MIENCQRHARHETRSLPAIVWVLCAVWTLGMSPAANATKFRLPLAADTAVHFYYDHDSSTAVRDWRCGTETYDGHRGTDFSGGPRGTAIFAAAGGTLYYKIDGFGDGFEGSTDGGGFGNHVVLDHGSGLLSYYGHMTLGSVTTTAVGANVMCSDQVGGVGTSGSSTGLHLHFEPRLNGVGFDPFAGSCSPTQTSWWVNQGTGSPATACESSGSTAPAAPSGVSATALSSTSVAVSWADNSNNETSFVVFRWNGSAWAQIGTVGANVTSYTDMGLQASTTYYHTVCAQNGAGAGCAATYSTVTTPQGGGSTAPTAPSGVSATAPSPTSVAVSWADNSNNETSFVVFRWNGSAWAQIGTVGANVTSYTDTGLQPSTTYFHTVCAQNSVGANCAATYSTATTLTGSSPPAAPSGMSATALSSSSIKVSWVDNSNNETSFAVFRWNGSSWAQIATVGANVTSYTDTGLQSSTTYFHTVCAQNSVGASCAVTYSTATTLTGSSPPAAPSGMSATALSSSSVAVSWVDNSNNETSFVVFRWNGSAWAQIATVGANVTSYTDTGLQPSTTYFHTVCAQNSVGASCAATYSTATTLTGSSPPAAPSGMSATALSSSSIAVSWVDNSNNETSFAVFRWNGSAWAQIATVGANVTSYMDTGLQPSTTYFHTVCAQNSAGAGCAATYSSATTLTGSTPPAAPSGMSATALSSSSIAVSWVDNSNNETGFVVYRWNGSAWAQIATVGANVTSFTDTGLQPSTTYFHTVCAQNSAGAGCAATYSTATTLTGLTAPAAPSGLSDVALSTSSIRFSWLDNSNNETSFAVFRWNGSAWVQIATVGANVTSYTDTGLQHATTYYHTVCSQNGVGANCASTYSLATTF
jgi:Peptidase family M23/Fibronectin type III domain